MVNKHNDALVVLPNKDLWRGYKHVEAVEPVEVVEQNDNLSPLDKALMAVKASQKGALELSCLWCGQQGKDAWMQSHIKTNHKSVLDRMTDGQVAMHELALAQQAKVESDANETE